MLGTYQTLPSSSNGTFLVLTHELKCRDLAGVFVGLAQNSIVKVFSVNFLPGWSILQNEAGWYAPVRNESVHQISVPATQNGNRLFPPAALADATVHDIIEVDPIFLIVSEDVVVCDSHGQGLAISAGSVVSIFAHSPTTFAWFKTADGQTFVADVRRPIKMRPVPQTQDNNGQGVLPEPTTQDISPTPQPLGIISDQNESAILETIEAQARRSTRQGDEAVRPLALSPTIDGSEEVPTDPDTIEESPIIQPEETFPVEDTPAAQSNGNTNEVTHETVQKSPETQGMRDTLTEDFDYFESDEHFDQIFLPEWTAPVEMQTAEPLAVDADFLRGVQASAQDFTNEDDDFCVHCFSFTIDHAAHCPNYRG